MAIFLQLLIFKRRVKMISHILFFFVSIYAFGILVESKTNLGDVIPVCSLKDVNVDECLKTSSQNIIPKLVKGIKGWHLVGLDPFIVSFVVGQDSGPISMRWEHINASISGFSRINIISANVSKKGDAYNFVFNLSVNNFTLKGDYKARGKMLFFPIKADGYQEIRSGGSPFQIKFQAKSEKKGSAEYLKIQKLELNFSFSKDIKIILKNAKKPNAMDKILSKFLTDNAQELVLEMRPTLEAVYGGIMKSYIQSVFNNVPVKELFKQ